MALKEDINPKSSTISFGGLVNSESVKLKESIPKYDTQIISSNNQKINLREQRNRLLNKDWYLRRKSYGFEKMTNEATSASKMLESTDSGIGRSDEITLSPTESKGTIIALTKNPSSTCITFSNGTHDTKQNQVILYRGSSPQDDDVKRHSIAVDEAKYVRDHLRPVFESKATSVHINGVYLDEDSRRSKRVEFCKTEIHFAAESGRVNIVETDEKPPPTNNFRRRRRSNSSSNSKIGAYYLDAINSGIPVTHFGDTEERTQNCTSSNQLALRKEVRVLNELTESSIENLPLTKNDESDDDADENGIRGILKNRKIKPKPYHLGENMEGGSLFGVKLRPVSADVSNWRIPYNNMIENDTENGTNVGSRMYSTKVNLPSSDVLSFPIKGEIIFSYICLKTIINKIIYVFLDQSSHTYMSLPIVDQKVSSRVLMRRLDDIDKEITTSKIKIGLSPTTYQTTKLVSPKTTVKIENDLKSTSLIMQTIRLTDRSPPEPEHGTSDIDISTMNQSWDSQQRNTLTTTKSQSSSPAMQLITQMNKIRRSSASNITTTSSSVSSSLQISSNRIRKLSTSIDSDNEFGIEEIRQKPIPAPRMKKIGPTNIVSQQLSQLRRMYAAADIDSDDSAKADEEVKHYLGNLVPSTASQSEEKMATCEKSKSWSRVKAKRTVKKQISTSDDELKSNGLHTNKMSIALHSPIQNLPADVESKIITPKIKTSNVASIKSSTTKSSTNINASVNSGDQVAANKTRKISTISTNEIIELEQDNSLKLTRGPRKLREHELSYFGVNIPKSDINSSSTQLSSINNKTHQIHNPPLSNSNNIINIKNSINSSIHQAKSSNLPSTTATTANISIVNNQQTINDRSKEWQLSNDKPDLLRHSNDIKNDYSNEKLTPILISNVSKEASIINSNLSSIVNNISYDMIHSDVEKLTTNFESTVITDDYCSEPIYENLRKISKKGYNRQRDLKRDEKILNEMNRDADNVLQVCITFCIIN